jgi:hypothetical protein
MATHATSAPSSPPLGHESQSSTLNASGPYLLRPQKDFEVHFPEPQVWSHDAESAYDQQGSSSSRLSGYTQSDPHLLTGEARLFFHPTCTSACIQSGEHTLLSSSLPSCMRTLITGQDDIPPGIVTNSQVRVTSVQTSANRTHEPPSNTPHVCQPRAEITRPTCGKRPDSGHNTGCCVIM